LLDKAVKGVISFTIARGEIIELPINLGSKVECVYNSYGQLENLNVDGDIIAAYSYNPALTISNVDFGNSVSTSYVYDNRDEIEVIDSGSDIFQRYYEYDPVGNLVEVFRGTSDLGEHLGTLIYDELDMLTNTRNSPGYFGDTDYVYDKAGNRQFLTLDGRTTSYTYKYEDSPGSMSSMLIKR